MDSANLEATGCEAPAAHGHCSTSGDSNTMDSRVLAGTQGVTGPRHYRIAPQEYKQLLTALSLSSSARADAARRI